MDINYQRLLTRIGHDFSKPRLLQQALTHRSYSAKNNERLEFLGDAILGLVISHILYERFENAPEGELSQLRASLVRGAVLADVARELAIGGHLRLGSGEMKSGGARRDTILADAMEAIVGAIFLDAGMDACRSRIEQWYRYRLDNLSVKTITKDAKTLLQEYLQGQGRELPLYQLIESVGDAHEQVFHVQCALSDSEETAVGEGGSRKKAEQEAAQRMYEQLDRLESQAARRSGTKKSDRVPVISRSGDQAITIKRTTEPDD